MIPVFHRRAFWHQRAKPTLLLSCIVFLGLHRMAQRQSFVSLVSCIEGEQSRKYLIDNNFIDCIIQLPSNLFFGTSIATCIMVLKKGKTDNTILFVDATNECIKVTNNNKLTEDNIQKIVDTFAEKEEKHFSYLAKYDEVVEQEYNLSVSTYVEAEDTREKIDIVKLNEEIAQIVAREQVLRDEIDKIIAEIEVE